MTLDTYKLAYEEAMRAQGIKVTWAEDGGSPYGTDVGGYRNPDNWVATLSRDGQVRETLVTLGRISVTNMTPEQLAAQDQWSFRQGVAQSSPQGQLPSTWFTTEDDDARRFYEVNPHLRPGYVAPSIPNPGPSPTVRDAGHTIQPAQAPNDPNRGTTVTNNTTETTPAGAQYTFWQWNYFFEQQTGRSGPDPAEVGVALGTQLMTGAEWQRAIGNWYGSPVSVPGTTTSGGGVGATPTTPNIPVGGSGSPGGGGVSTGGGGGGTTPVGGTNTGNVETRSFWAWNALKEQATGIVGDDPFHYGIQGGDQMTLAQWTALTAAYYVGKQSTSGGGDATKKDNTMMYLAAGLAVLVLLMRKG